MNFNETYKNIVDDLQPSTELYDKIRISEETKMMRFNKMKMVVWIAAACMVFGTTVFAAGKISGYKSWSNTLTEEKDISKAREDAEKLGVTLEIPADFSNGYVFDRSNAGGIEGLDEDGNAVVSGKSFEATYCREDASNIYLNVDPSFEPLVAEECDICKEINGIKVYFYDHIYKFVPSDYELTDEDRENMEKPGYNISYGSDEVEEQKCSGFIFEYEEKVYNILSFDAELSADEWYEMAEELLTK